MSAGEDALSVTRAMALLTCRQCGWENRGGSRFCSKCGAALTRACSACGYLNYLGDDFCGGCGQLLRSGTPPIPGFRSPESYTPKHLAEKILMSKSALEGERKQITVLFADLKGSMELMADRDPEEARKLLDPVLERMMEAVHRYEGTVNQVMGDGIMALFGAPVAHEDHAVRACYAALRMQEAIRGYTPEVRRSHGIEVQIRVGLNSGEVVVRSIGSDLRMDYTGVGRTTHLASRMEQLAHPGTIRLTGETLRLAEGFIQVTPLGPVPVKGLAGPVEVFELIGANPARTRLQAAAAQGLTRFVARGAETDRLRHAQETARAGRGQVVAFVGEPGVGKSRLFWEFTRSHLSQSWRVVESGSVSYGKATPYLPVVNLLKAYFQIEHRDDARKILEKVSGRLIALDLLATLPVFLELLDVPVEDPQWLTLDPLQRRQRTLDVCKRLLLRESQIQPLCLVFEDLQWIDSETQALLDSLVESLPTARVLLLVNYRPEYQHAWGSKTYYMQLRIDPLPPEEAEELLQALLGEDPGLQRLKRLLIERTEGNPLFLEESVRALVETQVLDGVRGAYRLAKALPTIQVPGTVQTVLAARIDRLPPEDKRLLQMAAVVGKDVPFALLQAIAEGPPEEVQRGLAHLQAAEFLYEASLFPEIEYTFKHALTHEVAYQSLLQERRRTLHARIGEAIERLYSDRLLEQIERLADHAFHGEVWPKAVTYLRGAGAKAAARSAHQEAVGYFERALAALGHLPPSRDRIQLAIDLRFELKTSLTPLAEWGRIFDCLREMESLAEMLGDQVRLGRVAAYASDCSRVLGDHARAIEAGRRALTVATTLGDLGLRVNANVYLGLAHYARGDYREASGFFRQNVESLTGELVRERFEMAQPPAVHSRAWLACSLAELGEFAEGVAKSEEALQIAAALGHPLSLSVGHFGVGVLRLQKGDFDEAIRELERGLERSRVWNIPLWFLNIAAALGVAYARSGRVATAVPLLEQAVERSVAMGRRGLHSIRLTSLGEAYLLAGRPGDAMECAHRALDLAQEHEERGCAAWTRHLLAEIASRAEPPEVEKAAEEYGRALALGRELGMRPLEARCRLGLGTLRGGAGARTTAETDLAAAAALFRELGMRRWLEQAEAQRSALR